MFLSLLIINLSIIMFCMSFVTLTQFLPPGLNGIMALIFVGLFKNVTTANSKGLVQNVLQKIRCGKTAVNEAIKKYCHDPAVQKGKAISLQARTDLQVCRRLKLPEFLGQSAHERWQVCQPMHWPPLPQETSLILISLRGLVNTRTKVRLEGLSQRKIQMIPMGIEPSCLQCSV